MQNDKKTSRRFFNQDTNFLIIGSAISLFWLGSNVLTVVECTFKDGFLNFGLSGVACSVPQNQLASVNPKIG